MQQFEVKNTSINELYLIHPFCNEDCRGYFIKDYSMDILLKYGINYQIREIFYSKSKKGTIRGMHIQRI